MRFLYTIAIWLYGLVARIFALVDKKAKLWVDGRKGLLLQIQKDLKSNKDSIIWFHSASLGEFEQGRPLIEKLKAEHPQYKILVTFFSPSGYEIRKNDPLADYVYYLPEDTIANARAFVELVQPKCAVFIKYEYWYNYMNQLYKQGTPLIFISSIFRPSQSFFKFFGGWFLKHLDQVDHFFVQNPISQALLKEMGIDQVRITGDTRFDRVAKIAEQLAENPLVKKFKAGELLFLGGSTWPEDEKLMAEVSRKYPELKILIAPHLIDDSHLAQIEKLFNNSIRYSKASDQRLADYQVLIIDNMGLLSSLYQYAELAMIGGGFGNGIHNTLEAATFGMPIFIGPNYHKFQEAKDLIDLNVIQVVKTEEDLIENVRKYLEDEVSREEVCMASKDYIIQNKGATQEIFDYMTTRL